MAAPQVLSLDGAPAYLGNVYVAYQDVIAVIIGPDIDIFVYNPSNSSLYFAGEIPFGDALVMDSSTGLLYVHSTLEISTYQYNSLAPTRFIPLFNNTITPPSASNGSNIATETGAFGLVGHSLSIAFSDGSFQIITVSNNGSTTSNFKAGGANGQVFNGALDSNNFVYSDNAQKAYFVTNTNGTWSVNANAIPINTVANQTQLASGIIINNWLIRSDMSNTTETPTISIYQYNGGVWTQRAETFQPSSSSNSLLIQNGPVNNSFVAFTFPKYVPFGYVGYIYVYNSSNDAWVYSYSINSSIIGADIINIAFLNSSYALFSMLNDQYFLEWFSSTNSTNTNVSQLTSSGQMSSGQLTSGQMTSGQMTSGDMNSTSGMITSSDLTTSPLNGSTTLAVATTHALTTANKYTSFVTAKFSKSGLSFGAVAGITIAVFVVVAFIVFIIGYRLRHRGQLGATSSYTDHDLNQNTTRTVELDETL